MCTYGVHPEYCHLALLSGHIRHNPQSFLRQPVPYQFGTMVCARGYGRFFNLNDLNRETGDLCNDGHATGTLLQGDGGGMKDGWQRMKDSTFTRGEGEGDEIRSS